jgi:hypothetical protein
MFRHLCVCAICALIAPTKKCSACAAPLPPSYKPTFGEWLTSTFFASLWLPKQVILIPSPWLESFPVAALVHTLELGSAGATKELMQCHIEVMSLLGTIPVHGASTYTPNSVLNTPMPTSPTSPESQSSTDTDSSSNSPKSSVPSSSSSTTSSSTSSSSTSNKVFSPMEAAERATMILGGAPQPTCPNAPIGRRRLVLCVRDDPLTTEGQKAAEQIPSTYALSVNGELERLTGYSREEMRARVGSIGWRMKLLYRLTSLALMGIQDTYHMECNILTKWGFAMRVRLYGSARTIRGYRTSTMFWVPLPIP